MKKSYNKKRDQTITGMLGITQLELAMLLRVSRPLIALYESGKRDLPAHTKELLAEMLTHRQTPVADAKKKIHAETVNAQLEEYMWRRLEENNFQRQSIDRKIKIASKSLNAERERMHLIDFLTERENARGKDAPQTYLIRMGKPTKKNKLIALTELELKQELLDFEKTLLESKLEKLKKLGRRLTR